MSQREDHSNDTIDEKWLKEWRKEAGITDEFLAEVERKKRERQELLSQTQHLEPGGKVRLMIDVVDPERLDDIYPGAIFVTGNKGSIGTVIPFEEFSDYVRKTRGTSVDYKYANIQLTMSLNYQRAMELGYCYPVRIDQCAPCTLQPDNSAEYVVDQCQTGIIISVPAGGLEKIE